MALSISFSFLFICRVSLLTCSVRYSILSCSIFCPASSLALSAFSWMFSSRTSVYFLVSRSMDSWSFPRTFTFLSLWVAT